MSDFRKLVEDSHYSSQDEAMKREVKAHNKIEEDTDYIEKIIKQAVLREASRSEKNQPFKVDGRIGIDLPYTLLMIESGKREVTRNEDYFYVNVEMSKVKYFNEIETCYYQTTEYATRLREQLIDRLKLDGFSIGVWSLCRNDNPDSADFKKFRISTITVKRSYPLPVITNNKKRDEYSITLEDGKRFYEEGHFLMCLFLPFHYE